MSLRHAILGILEYQPMHGYSLKRVLAEGVSTFWPVNLPAIYPSLRKLEEEGLVAHQVEATVDGRPDRKVFTITDEGRDELARWRRLPPDGPVSVRSPLFLKLLFAKGENLRDSVDWLDKAIEEVRTLLGQAHETSSSGAFDSILFLQFIRESGIAHLELSLEMLQDLRMRVAAIVEQRDARQGQEEVSGSENEPTRHQ
jgi:DNA-binding PadR family transcriptional regulator